MEDVKQMTGAELLPIVRSAGESLAGPDTRFGEAVSLTLADTWNGLIGDKVAAWRLKRAAKIEAMVRAFVTEKGVSVSVQNLPEHYALKWFETATKSEDSAEISEIFARLLVEAALGNKDAMLVRLLEIVNGMTANDAITFKSFVSTLLQGFERGRAVDQVLIMNVEDDDELFQLESETLNKIPGFDLHLSFNILESLGLVKMRDVGTYTRYPTLKWKFASVDYALPGPRSRVIKANIELTVLGATLYNAISGDNRANRLFAEAEPTP